MCLSEKGKLVQKRFFISGGSCLSDFFVLLSSHYYEYLLINVFSQVINIKVFADLASSESPLSGLKVALPLHSRREGAAQISLLLCIRTPIPSWESHPQRTSSKLITSQQFLRPNKYQIQTSTSMYDFGRGKNIHSITVCGVTDERESYTWESWLGCEELYKPEAISCPLL